MENRYDNVDTHSMKNTFVETDIEDNATLIEGNPLASVEAKTLEFSDFHENTNGKEQEKSSDWWWNAQT